MNQDSRDENGQEETNLSEIDFMDRICGILWQISMLDQKERKGFKPLVSLSWVHDDVITTANG